MKVLTSIPYPAWCFITQLGVAVLQLVVLSIGIERQTMPSIVVGCVFLPMNSYFAYQEFNKWQRKLIGGK